jgi:hypothetical protein
MLAGHFGVAAAVKNKNLEIQVIFRFLVSAYGDLFPQVS